MIPLGVGVDGAVITGGGEEEPFAVVAEIGAAGIVRTVGDGERLLRGEAVEHDFGEGAAFLFHVGDPLRVGRPGVLLNRGVGIFGDGGDGFRGHVDETQALFAVSPEEFFGVRRPIEREGISVVVGGELERGALAVLWADVEFKFAGSI